MRYKTILLFGAPGSGKGTQGKILGAIPGFFHTACGDIFRSQDLSSEMGRIAWEYSSRGELVPDEFTVKLWKQYIKGMEMVNQFHPETEILVLDGIPRNVKQAQLLEDTLDVLRVVHLHVQTEVCTTKLQINYARLRYSPVSVLIRIVSPTSINGGTRVAKPVSSTASFN